jgi:hypothetical protein
MRVLFVGVAIGLFLAEVAAGWLVGAVLDGEGL